MDCRTRTHAIDGATLVSVIVENPHDEAARFRVDNELDGPVRPPRRRGRPEPGWDENGYEGVLGPGERTALGYAVAADPAEPPATIGHTEPAGELDHDTDTDAGTTDGRLERSPEAVAGAFRDPRPPRGAITPIGAPERNSVMDGERP